MKQIKEKKKKGKEKVKEAVVDDGDDDFTKKVSPKEDYQVNQAINYLKSISLIKNLKF